MEILNDYPKTIQADEEMGEVKPYSEQHRPQFHFSPKKNWMNDPNGLITHKNVHHLYFQYNPHGNQWGHMSWGHATSSDRVHWQEHHVAIAEKEHMIFSGTTALDSDKETLIAAFTSFEHALDPQGGLISKAQHQSIAKSHDDGFSYQEIAENPVLDIGSTEFRDPKLFFDPRIQKWIMLVSLPVEHKVAFYQSTDLKTWKKVSDFGPLGNTAAVWECPDLFKLQVKDSDTKKWVLTLSAGHQQEGQLGMQYFIGDFNGTHFIPDPLHYPLYLDYGKDFYAGITFANTDHKDHVTMMAWVGSHCYGSDTPTHIWRGAMSLPRDLFLTETEKGHRLQSRPPHSYLNALYSQPWLREGLQLYNGIVEPPFKCKSFVARLTIKNEGITTAGIKILKSKNCETVVGVDFGKGEIFIDRTASSSHKFNAKFFGKDTVPIDTTWQTIQLDIFVDQSIVEVFVQNGTHTLTNLVFPDEDGNTIKLFARGGKAHFEKVDIRTVKSIWT
ncbi:hypothetical protein FGF1_34210 [Flavobacteriaceae bacterium GF1]